LLGGVQDIEQADDNAPLSGKLVVGATAMIAETVLPRLCVEFMRLHPEVQIRVEAEAVGDMFQRLARFELETALIEIFPDIDGIELVKWRTDELILVVAADHPLARRQGLRIKDLEGQSWCALEANSSTSSRLRYILHEQIGQIHVSFEATSNWAVRHAVIAGGGIGCLSRELVQFDLNNGRLCRLDVTDFSFTRVLSLARPKNIRRSRLTTAFDEFLLDRADSFEP
jgi:DNA-binding transcriptional LysR family regulator